MSDYMKYRRESIQPATYEPEDHKEDVLLISPKQLKAYVDGEITLGELAKFCGKLQMGKVT